MAGFAFSLSTAADEDLYIGEERNGKTRHRGVACQGEDHRQISGQRLRSYGQHGPHPRSARLPRLASDIEHDYAPQYISIKGKEKLIKELKSKAKHSDGVLLATDPDREGEAISWHLANILGPRPPTSPTA